MRVKALAVASVFGFILLGLAGASPAAAGSPFSYALWTRNAGGRAAVWRLDPASGAPLSRKRVSRAGIGARWQATSYVPLNDRTGFVLVSRRDAGQAALWQVNPLTGAVARKVWVARRGIGAGWQATSYVRVSATSGFVLWSRSATGEAQVWAINPAKGSRRAVVRVGGPAGIGAGWQASSFTYAGAAAAAVLWTNAGSGQAELWSIDPASGARRSLLSLQPPAGMGPGWLASGFEPADVATASVLWANETSGRAEVWTVDATTGVPISGWTVGTSAGAGPGWQATSYADDTPLQIHPLTVGAAHPAGSVSVKVLPVDTAGLGGGKTRFERRYLGGTVVTLTAPGSVGGFAFSSWTGCDSASGVDCTVAMQAPRTVTATYEAPGVRCEDCHGNPPHPGLDGIAGSGDDAPRVMGDGTSAGGVGAIPKAYDDGSWGFNVNGHGANGTAPATPDRDQSARVVRIRPDGACADCHDISQPSSGDGRHLNGILNSAENGLNASENTAHLIAAFVGPSSPSWGVQVAFDRACFERCHSDAAPPVPFMSHANSSGVSRFGAGSTPRDGESIPWPVDSDLTSNASVDEPDYAPCVSCHNPHGTDVPATGSPWNRMLRAAWVSPSTLCLACHR